MLRITKGIEKGKYVVASWRINGFKHLEALGNMYEKT